MLVAAIQMPSELLRIAANLERADSALREASQSGSALAVLPEMFVTGRGLIPDFGPAAEGTDGPTLRHLSGRSRQWRMGIAAGFVERAYGHLYDALALCLPDGSIRIYRKRHLVFWERFRFLPGRSPLIVPTPWGRIGLAICADMIYRNVWEDYRGQIDLGIIASAWPEFTCRHSGRKHWLFGRLGPLSAEIPVVRKDELELIRGACLDLGADLEMTELVQASHSHDRTLLDVMLADGDSLRDYVQRKLAIWEGIFNDSIY